MDLAIYEENKKYIESDEHKRNLVTVLQHHSTPIIITQACMTGNNYKDIMQSDSDRGKNIQDIEAIRKMIKGASRNNKIIVVKKILRDLELKEFILAKLDKDQSFPLYCFLSTYYDPNDNIPTNHDVILEIIVPENFPFLYIGENHPNKPENIEKNEIVLCDEDSEGNKYIFVLEEKKVLNIKGKNITQYLLKMECATSNASIFVREKSY